MSNSIISLLGLAVIVVAFAACSGGASPSPTPTAIITGPTRANTPTAAPTLAATATQLPRASATSTVAVPTGTAVATAPAVATQIPTTAPGATSAPRPTTAPASSQTSLLFRAANNAFDKTVVHVKSGAIVTATMQNDDSGVAHNLAFSLSGLGLGETCTGPCTATQTFTASPAGPYFFFCSIHPEMVGTFIVDP